MANLNPFVLCSRTITAVLSDVLVTEGQSTAGVSQTFWDNFAGVNGLTIVADFDWGSGGTTAILAVDTAFGSGGDWYPCARFDFAQADAVKHLVISRTGIVAAANLVTALGADEARNLIGDRFRARLTTTGVYAGGTLIDVRAQPHQ